MRVPPGVPLMALAALAILALVALAGTTLGQTDPPALGDGDWTVLDDTVIRDWDVIMLRGDLLVTDGGTLSLINSTLLFVNSQAGDHGIVVERGGTLRILEGATVGSSRPNVPLTFVVEAGCSLEIRDSFIEEVGMPAFGTRPDWEQISLYIGTSDAVIENTTFTGGLAGPYFEDGVMAPPVRNCTFENVYGIISFGVGIEDCTFRNQNLFGVVFHGGDTGYVARCVFESVFATCVQVGYEYFEPYELHSAEANVYDCTFQQSTRAIRVLDQSVSTIVNCTIDGMEREGIVAGNESRVRIFDGHFSNTFEAIESNALGPVDWTVTSEAKVEGGSVLLSGNITVEEDARLELVDFRNLTMLSPRTSPLWINLHDGSLMRLVNGDLKIPDPTAVPEDWAPVRMGPDPLSVLGALHLDDVQVLDLADGFHIEELRAVNCTVPLGTIWVEEIHLQSSVLVPDPRSNNVELTVGGSDGETECWFIDCRLEGIDMVSDDGAWLIVLDAEVHSLDFLYDLGDLIRTGSVIVQGGSSGPALIHVSWSAMAQVLWQNQMSIQGTVVEVVTASGDVQYSITDYRGRTGVLRVITEEFEDGGYASHLPVEFRVNISGLRQNRSVDVVEGPINVDLMVVDLIPPRLLMDQAATVATNSTNFTLSGRVVDDHSGVAFLEVAILPAPYARVELDPVTGEFSHSIVLTKGYQTISVRGYDVVGNRRGRLVEVFYSIVPPYVFIDEPLDETWVSSELTFVSGVTEDGATVELQGRVTEATNGSFRVPAYLVEGPNLLTINVTSLAGNHNSTQVLVYLDTLAPSLEVVFPPTATYPTRESSHNVRGMVEPGAQVYINQVPVDVDESGLFVTPQVNLDEGSTQVTLRAVDLAGNENVTQVVFVLDSVPPALVVLVEGTDASDYTGDEPLRTYKPTLTLSILTDEEALLYIDGEEVPMEGTQVTVAHILEEGLQSIVVRVEDQAGNWQEFPPIKVDVDWTPPNLSLDPGTPNTTEEALLTLRGTTDPNCTIVVNGGRVSVDTEGRFQRVFLLNEGDNTLVIVTTDRYGQSTDLVYHVSMVPPAPEPWPDAPSLLPFMLSVTLVILVVEAVVLHLYWRRRKRIEGTDQGPS